MGISLLHSEEYSDSTVLDLTSSQTVLTYVATANQWVNAIIELGDGADDLDGSGGWFEVIIVAGDQTLQPSPHLCEFSTATRSVIKTAPFFVKNGDTVTVAVQSPNVGDTGVAVNSYLVGEELDETLDVNVASIDTDAIDAASVKADAVTKIQSGLALEANVQGHVEDGIEAEGIHEADGVPTATVLKALMAVLLGKASVSGSDVVFKARDGSTTVVTVTIGSTAGERTASVIS